MNLVSPPSSPSTAKPDAEQMGKDAQDPAKPAAKRQCLRYSAAQTSKLEAYFELGKDKVDFTAVSAYPGGMRALYPTHPPFSHSAYVSSRTPATCPACPCLHLALGIFQHWANVRRVPPVSTVVERVARILCSLPFASLCLPSAPIVCRSACWPAFSSRLMRRRAPCAGSRACPVVVCSPAAAARTASAKRELHSHARTRAETQACCRSQKSWTAWMGAGRSPRKT